MAARRRSVRCSPVLLCLVLPFLTTFSISRAQTDTLRAGDSIAYDTLARLGGRLVSANGVFELGFFTLGSASYSYVGIWYRIIQVQTVVWVANRDAPLTGYGQYNLTLDRTGNLKIVGSDGSVVMLVQGASAASSAVLLDSGSLVVRGPDPNRTVLWQSFDNPTDTWLPGMRLRWDDGRADMLRLTSWRSPTDPGTGDLTFAAARSRLLVSQRNEGFAWDSGLLAPTGFSGDVPAPWGSSYAHAHLRFISDSTNTGVTYFIYNASATNASSLTRIVAEQAGQVKLYAWSTQDTAWSVFWAAPHLINPTPDTSGGGRKRQLLLALPIVSATLLFFGAGICCFVRKKRQAHEKDNGEELLLRDMGMDGAVTYKFVDVNQGGGAERGPEICLYSFSNVLAATHNFSDHNKLGEGGFGPVFKGKLSDGQEIAIKRLSTRSRQGLEEFKTEILLIARLQHKNLVRLLGCCLHGEEKLLIYEYMSNKSLDFFLFNSQRAAQLDWGRRIKIIEGIAQGLLYLHKYSRLTIIHRDLKASNILLDNEMNPKISDFGMARIFSTNECQANTNRIVGTYGYMSPEYAMQGLFSIKSDIFSFGVLLLELVSGKKNIGSHRYFPIPRSLLGYAWELWNVGKELELTDPSLSDSCPGSEVSRCIYIGLLCVQESANDRPTMTEVVAMLSSESLTRRELKPPAFLSGMQTTQKSLTTPNSINDVTVSALEG